MWLKKTFCDMGIYLNPDNIGFKEILAGKIYVDKTMLISVLNNFTTPNPLSNVC